MGRLRAVFRHIRGKGTLPVVSLCLGFLLLACSSSISTSSSPETTTAPTALVALPEPRLTSNISLEEALLNRRSIREYSTEPLSLAEVSQLLWAAQGITAEWGGRSAPSAGGLYPLEIYLEVGKVETLNSGVYKYRPRENGLLKIRDENVRGPLAEAALGQDWVRNSAINIVIAAVYARTTVKYGERGTRYVQLEAGHAAQNVCLEVTALDLGAVTVGAFDDDQVKKVLGMSEDESPLYVIPVGKKKT